MNPFQSPLNMSELEAVEELNPEVVYGLQDIKSVIDSVDAEVVTQGMNKLLRTEDLINQVYLEKSYDCAAIIERGEKLTAECDDYCLAMFGAKCDDIDGKTESYCATCSTKAIPSPELRGTLRDTEKIQFGTDNVIGTIAGKITDNNGRECMFVIDIGYCIEIIEGAANYHSCDVFRIDKQSTPDGFPTLLVTNCSGDGTGLICDKEYGDTRENFDFLFTKAIEYLIQQVNTGAVTCEGEKLPYDTLPYDDGDDTINGGGGGDTTDDKCCPPSKTIVNVPPCPAPEVNVTVNPQITIERVIAQTEVNISDDETIIAGNGTPGNETCPDRNEIDALVTICGEGRIQEFIEREGIKFITQDASIGAYLNAKWNADQVESNVSLYRS